MSAILLIAIPLVAAFLSILSKKIAPYLLLLVALGNVLLLQFISMGQVTIGGFSAPYGISLIVDDYSLTALYIVNVLFFLVIAITLKNYQKLSSVLLVSLAGLNGLLLTGDLFNLFVFLEITGISAYLITTTNKKPLATFNYLVQGTVGSSLYLLGLIILYAMFGTLNMAHLANQISNTNFNLLVTSFPFLLMFIGLGVEAKLLPLNSWVKGVLASSNTLSGPMIASTFAAATLFVFGRLIDSVFVIDGQLGLIITGIVLFSIVAGEAMAYQATKAREIFLYSSIAQAGLVILLFVNGVVGWAVLMIIANAISKLVLFLVVNEATEQLGNDDMNTLEGLFVNNKVVGVTFTIAALSVIGLPVFLGFVVKMNMLQDLIALDQLWIVVVLLLSAVVEGVYFVKLLVTFWYKKEDAPSVTYDVVMQYVIIVIALFLVVFGMYTAPIENHANDLDVAHYVEGGTAL